VKKLGKFFYVMFHDWWSGLSGPPSVPLAIIALYASSTHYKIIFGSAAMVLGFFSAYRIWSKEYDRAEHEIALNALPEIVPEVLYCFYAPDMLERTKQSHLLFALVRLLNKRNVNTSVTDLRLTITVNGQTHSGESTYFRSGTLVFDHFPNSPGVTTTVYGFSKDKLDLDPLVINQDAPLTRGVHKDGWIVFTTPLRIIGPNPQSASVTLEVTDSFGNKHTSGLSEVVIRHATLRRG
jgi:hypothetical protein